MRVKMRKYGSGKRFSSALTESRRRTSGQIDKCSLAPKQPRTGHWNGARPWNEGNGAARRELNAQVAIAAPQCDKARVGPARQFDVHPNQIARRKAQVLEWSAKHFGEGRAKPAEHGHQAHAGQDRAPNVGKRLLERAESALVISGMLTAKSKQAGLVQRLLVSHIRPINICLTCRSPFIGMQTAFLCAVLKAIFHDRLAPVKKSRFGIEMAV